MLPVWLVAAEFAAIAALNVLAVWRLAAVFALFGRLRSQRQEVSSTLRVYLTGLWMMSISLIFTALIMTTALTLYGGLSPRGVYWSGVVAGCLVPATPIGVFYLTVEQIGAFWRLRRRAPSCTLVAGLSAASIAVLAAVNAAASVIFSLPDADVRGCMTFACLASPTANLVYAINRMVVAAPNFVSGCAFLILLLRSRLHKTPRRKMGDRVALAFVALTLVLDMLPSLINVIFTYCFTINISRHIGPYRQLLASLNTLGCAQVNLTIYRTLYGNRSGKKIGINVISPS